MFFVVVVDVYIAWDLGASTSLKYGSGYSARVSYSREPVIFQIQTSAGLRFASRYVLDRGQAEVPDGTF